MSIEQSEQIETLDQPMVELSGAALETVKGGAVDYFNVMAEPPDTLTRTRDAEPPDAVNLFCRKAGGTQQN